MAQEPEAVTPAAPEAAPAPVEPVAPPAPNPNFTRGYGTGRRKESVARVFLTVGSGVITVNGRKLENYFPLVAMRRVALKPLEVTGAASVVDIRATAAGGGINGQADALRLGIARALLEYNIELRKPLKKAGMLTRDPRVHERKKYGQKGARKRFQFSKR
jgi:small subunit ribosomal protein S9